MILEVMAPIEAEEGLDEVTVADDGEDASFVEGRVLINVVGDGRELFISHWIILCKPHRTQDEGL